MDVIILPNLSIIRDLPYQRRVKGKKYRLNKLLVFLELDNGDKLIYNELTRSLVRIRPEEFETILTDKVIDYNDFLYRNYFVVTEDFDEIGVVTHFREKQTNAITENYLDSTNHFTILTTTKCNARCFYCYELLSKNKHHMTKETAEKVALYIINVANKKLPVQLSWFGGEPLFNTEAIDIITSKLKNEGFTYTSDMISNSFLFDELTIKKAINDWHLKNVLVTLDGTEEVYNKTKRYIYKDVNPFLVVINNTKNLVNNNIHVSVRLNCDNNNIDNLIELVEYLGKEFLGNKNFGVYAHSIFEIGEFKRSEELNLELYKKMETLLDRLIELKFTFPRLIPNIKGKHCMCDSGTGVMISVDGDIGLCEHYIDSDFFSHVDTPDHKDFNVIRSWRLYKPAEQKCLSCPLYPSCLKLIKCPDEADCSEGERLYLIHSEQKAMLLAYLKYRQSKLKLCKITKLVIKELSKPLTLIDKIKHIFSC